MKGINTIKMIKNKKILITGSKGFIGGHLYNSLSNENEVSTCDKKDNSDLKYGVLLMHCQM